MPHDHHHNDHDHGHHHEHGHSHVHEVNEDSERRVLLALSITGAFMLIEIIVGLTSNSLALLSDGIHMLSDAFSLGLALAAFRMGRRPPDVKRSYGYQRMQVLAAFTNGLIMLLLAVWIVVEALERLWAPEAVAARPMMVVAILGLVVNAVSFWVLESGDQHNLNMRGAALHVLGDLLGSVAAIVAALIIMFTGYTIADPLLSILACVLIVRSSVAVLRRSTHLLLEGTPEHVASDEVRAALQGIEGVADVHDLHLWGLTDNEVMLSAHLVVTNNVLRDDVLAYAHALLDERFSIGHATLQIEGGGLSHTETCCHGNNLHP